MPELENARDREIVRRIRDGDTYEAIGSDCGITRQRVQQIAERYGARPLRVDEKPLSEAELAVAQMLETEPRLSYQEVAGRTGLSLRQVRRVAEKAGLAWMRWPVYRRGIQPWDYDEDPDTGLLDLATREVGPGAWTTEYWAGTIGIRPPLHL